MTVYNRIRPKSWQLKVSLKNLGLEREANFIRRCETMPGMQHEQFLKTENQRREGGNFLISKGVSLLKPQSSSSEKYEKVQKEFLILLFVFRQCRLWSSLEFDHGGRIEFKKGDFFFLSADSITSFSRLWGVCKTWLPKQNSWSSFVKRQHGSYSSLQKGLKKFWEHFSTCPCFCVGYKLRGQKMVLNVFSSRIFWRKP